MKLIQLQASNLRNLSNVSLDLDQGLNLFCGLNGSGKTSILESVYYLGTGRSFRGTQIDPIIQRGQSQCLVTGTVLALDQQSVRLGVQRDEAGRRLIRIDGETCQHASDLARYLPSLLLGPSTVELLTGSPGLRRNFLNWGVFHVKPQFSELWREGTRTLKQRNAVLREGGSPAELEVWTTRLAVIGDQIHQARQDYFDKFLPVFSDTYRSLMQLEGVKCRYRRGWSKETPLLDVFNDQLGSDRHRRFTQSGFQRADIHLTIEGSPVAQTCSRGELKLLSWAMVLAQGVVLSQKENSNAIFLVDDLAAELDERHQAAIAELLVQQGGQVLVTGTDSKRLKGLWGKVSRKLFHVEQGEIREQELSE
ncbi:MAG: DNA replication and repair protein RecF [Candidatus Azotimanducaceae bacterium]|jgi:DNA replication and repair protein RecF